MKCPEILWPAQRQHRHNSGGNELIPAFDYEITIEIVGSLCKQHAEVRAELAAANKLLQGYGEANDKLGLIDSCQYVALVESLRAELAAARGLLKLFADGHERAGKTPSWASSYVHADAYKKAHDFLSTTSSTDKVQAVLENLGKYINNCQIGMPKDDSLFYKLVDSYNALREKG